MIAHLTLFLSPAMGVTPMIRVPVPVLMQDETPPADAAPADAAQDQAPAQAPEVDEIPVPQPPTDPTVDAEVRAHLVATVSTLTTAQGAVYETALASTNARGEAWADLGLAYEANTMWSRALPCYRMASAFLPEKPEWVYRQGVCALALGDLRAAFAALEDAADRLKNTTVVQARFGETALLLGKLDVAEAAWRQAIASEAGFDQPVRFPETRVGLAQVLIETEAYEEAETLLREALAINPGYRHAHHLLGTVLDEIGDPDEAAFELLRGRNAFPAYPPDPHQPRLAGHGASYQRRMMGIENMLAAGNLAGANEAIEAVLAKDPKDHFALNLKARGLMMQNRHAEAYAVLAEAEQVDPNHYATLVEMAITCMNRMQSEPDKVQELLQEAVARSARAVELAPLVGRPWYVRGLAESIRASGQQDPQAMQQGMQTALQLMQRAHALGCEDLQMYQSMAQMFAQLGQLDEMVRYAIAGTDAQPENPQAWVFRSQAHITVVSMADRQQPSALSADKRNAQLDQAGLAVNRAVTVSRQDPNIAQFARAMTAEIAKLRR